MERIVVGTDGSEHSEAALRWALRESQLHGVPMTAVLAWDLGNEPLVSGGSRSFQPGFDAADAERVLDEVVHRALPDGPMPDLEVVCDLAPAALIDRTAPEHLVVVGARGRGGFEGLVLGSVSQRVISHARGPVAVVPLLPSGDDTVVVGVDGSERSEAALRWAAGEARARGAHLTIVQAWELPVVASSPWVVAADADLAEDVRSDAEANLGRARASVVGGGLEVSTVVGSGNAARALLRQAGGLIVVGSRGAGLLRSVLLGSVAHQVLHHASTPVVVVPSP